MTEWETLGAQGVFAQALAEAKRKQDEANKPPPDPNDEVQDENAAEKPL